MILTNCTATCLLSRKLFNLDEPDMQDTAGEAGTSSYGMYSCGPPHMAVQKQDDQHEHTFSSYVRIRDVVQKTCLRRWTIGKSGERGSGISVLPARHDDDDIYAHTHALTDTQLPPPTLFCLKIIPIWLDCEKKTFRNNYVKECKYKKIFLNIF